jgi:hypothetical protein
MCDTEYLKVKKNLSDHTKCVVVYSAESLYEISKKILLHK